jgi:hypothetical protein
MACGAPENHHAISMGFSDNFKIDDLFTIGLDTRPKQ